MVPKHVVILGGGLSSKHCAELLVKQRGVKVTIVQANAFVEWPIAIPVVLTKPDMYPRAVLEDGFQVRDVNYKFGVVEKVAPAEKTIHFKDETLQYDVLIVATGFHMPLIYPDLGVTLDERRQQLRSVSSAIEKASAVVVGGGGIVALEVACNIRTTYPCKKVTLHCREKVLPTFPESTRTKVLEVLSAMKIVVVAGAAESPANVVMEAGSLTVGGEEVAYDVYIPAYSRGPNTSFLDGVPEMLDHKAIKVNEFLQSEHEEIFAVGTGNVRDPFVGIAKLQNQWEVVAANIANYLSGKPLKPYKEGMPFMTHPPLILLGNGKGAWGMMDFSVAPPPLRCVCCCGRGGFPFCPPPCCWPICSPCCCGYCGGPSEGSNVARGFEDVPFKSFGFHFKGGGESAPQQVSMA